MNLIEHTKKQKAKIIFDKILKDNVITLSPVSFRATESNNLDFTEVDFSFKSHNLEKEEHYIEKCQGLGFIDSIFNGLAEYFSSSFTSLNKIKLLDFEVNPKILGKKGTDSKVNLVYKIKVDKYGTTEFHHESRSILHSGLVLSLNVFEFYMNCEKCFLKINNIIDDAKNRNRSDIVQKCLYDLSIITEVNSYEKIRKTTN